MCSGLFLTILNILTHCFFVPTLFTNLFCNNFVFYFRDPPTLARLGGSPLDERHKETIKIKRIIQHPDYNAQYAYNDIAIVKLEKSSR